MEGRVVKYFLLSLFVFGGILCVMLILLLGVTTLNDKNDNALNSRDGEVNLYHYLQYNPKTHKSTTGSITLLDYLENDDFRSYQDVNGNHILISNFETDRYECTGYCYCESSTENRRVTSSVASNALRKLFYLVAASSTVLAVEFAKNHFDEECVNMLIKIDDCVTGSNIQSGVIDCRKEATSDWAEKLRQGHRSKYKSYECMGNCMVNPHFMDYPTKFNEVIKRNLPDKTIGAWESSQIEILERQTASPPKRCGEMFLQQYVNWREFLKDIDDETMELMKNDPDKAREITEEMFTRYYLRHFCRFNSGKKLEIKDEEILSVLEKEFGREGTDFGMCVASSEEYPVNPTVKCIEDPEEIRAQ